jgi:hypothetical protein
MWGTTPRVWFAAGITLLVIVVAGLQSRKECRATTLTHCVTTMFDWAGQGRLSSSTVLPQPTSSAPEPAEVPDKRPESTSGGLMRTLILVNSGDVELAYFYATSCDDPKWGRDRLGRKGIVEAHKSQGFDLVDVPGACCFDLRARFKGDVIRTRMKANICQFGRWEVSNR